jgi:hypothetical protein
LLYQAFDTSAPAFSEMMVRHEHNRLRHRFTEIIVLSAALAAVTGVIYATCNSSFVALWTHGKIHWPAGNDVLLGLWLLVTVLVHAYGAFILLTKQVAGMRYVYLAEGVVFVLLASWLTPRGGLPAMIACSLGCGLLCSGAYGVMRITRYFQTSVDRQWMGPVGRILAVLTPVAVAVWWWTDSVTRLVAGAAVSGGLGGYLFLRWGIPAGLRAELRQRAPAFLGRWFA